ncbi:MAG: DUF1579 domain-containing protein [Chitinophagaceae bacterium]
MKRLTNTLCMAMLITAIACNDSAKTDDSIGSKSDSSANSTAAVTDETPTLKDTAAINKAWMAYATPGEMHAMFAKDNGTWETEVTNWMTPDAPPMKSKGTATNKMILDGHYQQSTFKGDMGGMPFEGMSTVGYDNSKKKVVSTWVDNMGTGIMYMEGDYDAASKTTNFTGTCVDIRNGKECKMRETFKIVDENTQMMEMYMTYPGGKEYKNMEIMFKRKK